MQEKAQQPEEIDVLYDCTGMELEMAVQLVA